MQRDTWPDSLRSPRLVSYTSMLFPLAQSYPQLIPWTPPW